MPDDLISRSALLQELNTLLADEFDRRAVPKSGVFEILKVIELVKNIGSDNHDQR